VGRVSVWYDIAVECHEMISSLIHTARWLSSAFHTDKQVAVLFPIRDEITDMKRGLKCTDSCRRQLH
jgi:hypothetical protein